MMFLVEDSQQERRTYEDRVLPCEQLNIVIKTTQSPVIFLLLQAMLFRLRSQLRQVLAPKAKFGLISQSKGSHNKDIEDEGN